MRLFATMSFVQRLSQRSSAAQDQQVASDRQKIQQWVAAQVTRFEQACEQESDRGNFAASFSFRAEVPQLNRLNTDSYQTELQQTLGAYGFENLAVAVNNFNDRFSCRLSFSASWGGAGAERCEAGRTTARGGFVGPCGICHEDRPLVVLAPCGHALCRTCQQQIGRECPFCRQCVHTTTCGLFID